MSSEYDANIGPNPDGLHWKLIMSTMDVASKRKVRWKDFGKAIIWADRRLAALETALGKIAVLEHSDTCSGELTENCICDCHIHIATQALKND